MSHTNKIALLLVAAATGVACSAGTEATQSHQSEVAGDECNTTAECQAIYGSAADDCFNSQSSQSVCYCSGAPCSSAPPPPPPPTGDECNTTAQCQAIYGSAADDCFNSQSSQSVCYCSGQPCSSEPPPPPPPPPPPTGDECDTTSECQAIYGSVADDCFNSQSSQSVCYCSGSPCSSAPPPPPPPPPPPTGDECNTTAECQAVYGSAADDCFNSQSSQSVCYCSGQPCGNPPPPPSHWRVGYSADGNQHDPDDWHASPMALAVLHRAGLKSRLVHFDYNNHLGDNNPTFASNHKANITAAIQKFGYNSGVFFDDQVNLSGAVQSIANAINASSASNRFLLICAGPMEVCWRGINAAQDSKEQYVTVISHSSWNDNHQDTSQMSHTWSSIQNDFNVQAHHINDQNGPAFKSSCSSWNWLKQAPGYGNEMYDLVCTGAASGDASDAGMMYYVVQKNGALSGSTGTSSPTMSQVQSFFGG